jgi:predicted transcriptional regulator
MQELGFSEYEARAYVALLQRNPLNGYELAKVSGIPRPNVYGVLQKLQDRQAVTAIETPAGIHYVPLPPERLTERLNEHYDQLLAQTQQLLTAAVTREEEDVVWNLRDRETILQQAQGLIRSARESVVLALWQSESSLLADVMQYAQQRSIKLTTLCLQACPSDCGACPEHVYRYHAAPSDAQRWLIVVRDEEEMLFASFSEQQSSAMHTRQLSFVQMASWYVRHSIALTAILDEAGEHLRTALSPQTYAALRSAASPNGQDWLDYMLDLVRQNPHTS